MSDLPLFVYGSLLSDEVVELVIGRVASSESAVLQDHACYYVSGATFPGIIQEPGKATSGRLLLELSESEIQALDQYEDLFYQRLGVRVRTSTGERAAMAYVVPDEQCRVLSSQPWTWEEFQRDHLWDYLIRMRV